MPLDAEARLDELTRRGLLREPPQIDSAQGPTVDLGDHRAICLCSNNYLGFADDPRLLRAARDGLDTWGLGAGASRLISGTMAPHRLAEDRLARFVGAESALLFSTGYTANVGTIQTLVGPGDQVFSDRLNHASLIDGCRLSRATVHVYRHCDPEHLERQLQRHRADGARALIVTDAVFSMDGDGAPVSDLRALADRYDAPLLVDEAHALGVVGPSGRGHCAAHGVAPDILVGTLGKAFGVSGAFVAGSAPLTRLLLNAARSFVFSTAPAPCLAQAVQAATDLVEAADDRRARLADHAHRLRTLLRELGYRVPDSVAPIVPVLIGDADRTMRLSSALLTRGVFAQGIRPPTVPDGTSRIRCVPIATHTDAHIDHALDAFRALATEPAP